jgi:uncharacterized membrane protein (DUF4010 family)
MVTELFQRLALALAIGFLVGVERGWKQRHAEDESRVAGIRTYALIGLLGGVAGLLGRALDPIAFAAIVAVFGLGWIAYKLWETWIDGDISMTGVAAGLLVLALGAYAAVGDMQIAAAAGVAVVAILAFKEAAHNWVRELKWEEIRSALFILAATFIALPLLPDRALDPYGAFNPRSIWLLTIVIACASFAGYVAVRALGPQAGLYVAAGAGAIVSSTVVTLELARRVKAGEAQAAQAAGAASLANFVMFARIGVLIAVFATPALARSAPAIAAACAVAAAAFAIAALRFRHGESGSAPNKLRSPLNVRSVLQFALILALITAAARIAAHFHGNAGLVVFAATAGLADVDAVALAVGGLAREGLDAVTASEAILLAAAVNTFSKMTIATIAGGWRFAAYYGAASLAALAAGAAAFVIVS